MKINVLFGGQAGQGPNILTNILGLALVKRGYYVFYSRDYQSLIRGGHNFNVLTFSDEPVYSNDSEMDIIIALDENTEKLHKKQMKKDGVLLKGNKGNMYFAGRLFKLLCLDFSVLDEQLKNLEKRYEENVKEAKEGYDEEEKKVCRVVFGHNKNPLFMNGNQGISEGAIKAGLDVYYAYPMTPATNVLGELAEKQIKNNHLVLELENEISVINTAIGSSVTGAKAMIGTSGGGFDLMTEALSLTGMAEVPLVIYLASRPGPSTGVATYTGQGDLQLARHSGHGEFPRVILTPGEPGECAELTSQAFYLSQKFGIPVIVLSDKHLAESFYTVLEKPVITKSGKLTSLRRYNSYETDETGSATENAERIIKNVNERKNKTLEIEKEAGKFKQYNVYGNKNSKNVVVSFGSTKGAIIDAIKDLNVKFIQFLYIEPFPKEVKKLLQGNIILVENSATGQLADVIAEKIQVVIPENNKILRFDGRPFLSDELKEEIRRKIK
ncbi:MAG TPA: 2-oxoacid:acceptor oxidoreductase family protein [Patescibacteria group bacterium]|nr:2-oxoacid:acceptor oxidoreductase family protein [Patescibacteria group bacterium]